MSASRPITAPSATAVPPASASPLDPQALAALAELDPGGASGLVRRVLQTYLSSMTRLVAQIDQAQGAGDLASVRLAAHTLKSSSASIGALRLSALCVEAERQVRDAVTAGLGDVLDQLRQESALVRTAVDALLREPA